MAYDDLEYARLYGEMLTLGGHDVWDRVEDALWQRRQREHAAWAAHGQWWRSTTLGKRSMARAARVRAKRLQRVVVAVSACKACGKLFERTAYQAERKHGRVCSAACRGRARQNIALVTIGRESMPLVRWAERYGLSLGTVHRRLKLGWSITRALEMPARKLTARRAA